MDADDLARVHATEFAGDLGAPVTALHAVPLVTQPAHQLGERCGDPAEVPAGLAGWPREPEPGDTRQYQVERVGRIASVGPGIC